MPGLKLSKGIRFQDAKPGEAHGALFEIASEKVYTLNAAGCVIVKQIINSAEPSVDFILKKMKETFEDPESKIDGDTKTFLDGLKAAGILE